MLLSWQRGLLALAFLVAVPASAQDKAPIKIGLLLDFTAVYTFLTDEYNQGQQDYIALVNARGGIDGHPVEAIIRDHGNQPQRGIEAYNRAKSEGAILVDFLSTPVSRANIRRALEDNVVVITALHGRGDASDGETFPFIFPLMATYWSQATVLLDHIDNNEGGLQGKKVALVYIDSPFGREPVPVIEELSERLGFTFQTYPYPSPGTEQSATWSKLRRYRPNYVLLWGAGGGQPVAVREAIRNGISTEQLFSVVWMAETDMKVVGEQNAKGVKRFEAVATGRDVPLIQAILDEVVAKGNGSGPEENVGTTYYNIGVATMAIPLEGARIALEAFGEPLTADKLRRGIEMIEDFTANGLTPPLSFSAADHQGGGYGRVSQWDGEKWVPLSDWRTAYQEVVREEIEKGAQAFREGN